MRIIKAPVNGAKLFIGKQGENLATKVSFNIDRNLICTLLHKRNGDTYPYAVQMFDDGVWTVTELDTNKHGIGLLELQMRDEDGLLIKSVTYQTEVIKALGEVGETPEPVEAWLDRMAELSAETERHASNAEEYSKDAVEAAERSESYVADAEEAARKAEDAVGRTTLFTFEVDADGMLILEKSGVDEDELEFSINEHGEIEVTFNG